MEKQKLYEDHFNIMTSKQGLRGKSLEEIKEIFSNFLLSMPNGGKLYKYRSIDGESFEHTYDGLKEGYLWVAKASTLNDDLDCALQFDPEKEVAVAKREFQQRPWTYFFHWQRMYPDTHYSASLIETYYVKCIMKAYNADIGALDSEKAIAILMHQCSMRRGEAVKFLERTVSTLNSVIEERCRNVLSTYSEIMQFNNKNREHLYVYSMSELYNSRTMWGRYTANRGFCIEYDFTKVLNLSQDMLQIFCSLYKIIYEKELKSFSFLNMHRYYMDDLKDDALYCEILRDMMTKWLTKTDEWKDEKEWRLFLFELRDSKIYADLVSGIIIDERALNTDNCKRLLRLAKERGWEVKVRRKNLIGTGHDFVLYKND